MASSEPVRKALVGKDGPKFAAHAAFFPGGSYAFFGPEAHTGVPVLLMLGAKDDWAPAKRVIAAATYLKNETPSLPIEIKQYDAYHGWFSTDSRNYSNNRKSFADCPYTLFAPDFTKSKITVDGEVSPLSVEEWKTMYKQCRKSGATLEGNSDVSARSLDDVTAFLKRTMAN